MNEEVPLFYYYRCTGTEYEIPLASFTKMGTSNERPSLLSDVAGTELADILVITVDFTSVTDNNSNVSSTEMTLKMVVSGSDIAEEKVSYSTKEYSTVTEDNGNITVEHNGDTQFTKEALYLIISIVGNMNVSPDAYIVLNGSNIEPIRLNGNSWYVPVGYAEFDIKSEYAVEYVGFGGGDYGVIYTLVRTTEADGDRNVIGTQLASTRSQFSIEEEQKNEMSIVLETVNGQKDSGTILSVGSEHVVTFSYRISSPNVGIEMIGEMLTEEAGYQPVEAISLEQTDNGITAKFSPNLRAGTYRITFSIDSDTINDNIYFLFIVE
jgi:hypothetical protein